MKLVKTDKIFRYLDTKRITQFDLLSKYNPYYISKKIAMLSDQIEDMYHLTISHTENTGIAYTAVSYPLESLVIWIVEQKLALERYKKQSSANMNRLRIVMSAYSKKEQKSIKHFMRTNGLFYPEAEIKMLVQDLEKMLNDEVTGIVREKRCSATVALSS